MGFRKIKECLRGSTGKKNTEAGYVTGRSANETAVGQLRFDSTGRTVTGAVSRTGLEKVVIPGHVTRIAKEAFRESAVQEVYIPNSVTEIGKGAFYHCRELKKVRLPAGLTAVPALCFSGCESLAEVVWPEALTEIGSFAFLSSGLQKLLLPDKLEVIHDCAFQRCPLTEIRFGSRLKRIGENAFFECGRLAALQLPEGLEQIGKNAFRLCGELRSVYVPDSLRTFVTAFEDCGSIESFRIPAADGAARLLPTPCGALKRLTVGGYSLDTARIIRHLSERKTNVLPFLLLAVSVMSGNDRPLSHGVYGFDETVVYDMLFRLAENGMAGAKAYILSHIFEALENAVKLGDAPVTSKLLDEYGVSPGAEKTDKLINYAIDNGQHEVYVILLNYKKDKLGFADDDSAANRFKI